MGWQNIVIMYLGQDKWENDDDNMCIHKLRLVGKVLSVATIMNKDKSVGKASTQWLCVCYEYMG